MNRNKFRRKGNYLEALSAADQGDKTGASFESTFGRPVTDTVRYLEESAENKLFCTKEAAREIHVEPQTMAQWRHNKKVNIPFVRIGRKVMYRKSDLEAFISANIHGTPFNGMGVCHD